MDCNVTTKFRIVSIYLYKKLSHTVSVLCTLLSAASLLPRPFLTQMYLSIVLVYSDSEEYTDVADSGLSLPIPLSSISELSFIISIHVNVVTSAKQILVCHFVLMQQHAVPFYLTYHE